MAIDMSQVAAARIVADGILITFEINDGQLANFASFAGPVYGQALANPAMKMVPLVNIDTRAYATPELAAQALIDKALALHMTIEDAFPSQFNWGFKLIALGAPYSYDSCGPGVVPVFTNHPDDIPADFLDGNLYNPGQSMTVSASGLDI